MSAIAATGGGTGTLATLIADAAAARGQLDALTRQAASGKIADTLDGLSRGQTATSLSIGPALATHKALAAGIDAAQGRMDVAQSALKGISDIASSFYAQTNHLNGLNAGTVDSIAASAREALHQVAGLVDSRDGDIYVFAGDDSGNPPIPQPDAIGSSAFATGIAGAVANLGSYGAAATASRTLALARAGGTPVFSVAIEAGTATAPTVATGEGQRVRVGLVAGRNADVVSGGASTTGSWLRDVMRGLATLGALSGSQVATTGFSDLVADTRTSLGGAITALNQDAGAMGDRQTALKATQTTLTETVTSLTSQLSTAEDVDMTATLSNLTAAQTRLQASYQIIAQLQQLSLTRFLSG